MIANRHHPISPIPIGKKVRFYVFNPKVRAPHQVLEYHSQLVTPFVCKLRPTFCKLLPFRAHPLKAIALNVQKEEEEW